MNDICSEKQVENYQIYQSYLWYACLAAGNYVFGIFVVVAFYRLTIVATGNVHDIALVGLLKSPMRFFNINPPGRLLNRFTQGDATNLNLQNLYNQFQIWGKLTNISQFAVKKHSQFCCNLLGYFVWPFGQIGSGRIKNILLLSIEGFAHDIFYH